MKQKLLFTGLIALMLVMTSMRGWGQILTFEFSALAGDEVSAVSNANDANLTPSTITRGAGLTAAGNGGRFNATNWAVTSIANAVSGNNYMEFTITPQSGYQFSVSSIYIQLQRSGTGPRGIAIRNSVDSYAANLDQEYPITDITSTQSFTFTFSQSASSSAVTYRVYMWAEATGGSGGIGDGSGDDIIVSGVVTAVGGNQPPSITNVMHTPISGVTSSTSVSVSADITDSDGTIEGAELHWGTSSGSLGNTISMSLGAGSTYTTDTDIPAQAGGSTVYYEVYALDNDAGDATSSEQSYAVLSDEPTNHATGFAAAAISSTSITVSWTDSDASSYLVKGSTVGLGDIVSPADGVAETDALLVKNVNAATPNSVDFTGLTASTTYYFKIFPYNGTGEAVNYKTDGSVPEANAMTDAAAAAPIAWINEFHYDNTGTSDIDESIEVVVKNAGDFTLSDITVSLYNGNGGAEYDTKILSDFTPGTVYGDFTFYSLILPVNGLQNGSPDGLALSYQGTLISGQFISYEGSLTATNGPANGLTSEDIGVSEPGTTPVGYSLQLSGHGTAYGDFSWQQPSQSTLGTVNNGQSLLLTNWLGATNNEWNTGTNWDNGVPSSAYKAVIADVSTDPVVNGTISVTNLEINAGGQLTLANDGQLTVTGTLSNNAGSTGLTIASDNAGTGSLLHNSANVPATIERYITGNSTTNGTYDYHTVSVPLNSNGTAGLFTGSYLYQFNTATQLLESMGSDVNTVLPNNQGYMIFYPEAFTTYNFTGQLNNGDFPIPTAQGLDEFTLAPNPYPSAIDWDAAAGWTKTNLYDAIWIWNPAADNYATYGTYTGTLNATQYIPVGQAFFVKANAAASALTVKNEARVHNDQAFFKNQTATQNLLRVKTATSESADEMIVRFMPGASNGADPYDIDKIIGGSAAPQLYSLINGDRMATVNTLPYSAETLIVPMAYELSNDETASLNFEGVDSFDPTVEIFLEDLMTNQMINLRETASYQFNHAADDTPDRFRLHFMGVTATPEIGEAAGRLKVCTAGDQLYIHTSQPQGESLQIELFDANGRLLQSLTKANESPVVISSRTMQGLILVRVTSSNDVQTQKVFIR